MNTLKSIRQYFLPEKRIARKARWLQMYAAKHNFTVATCEFSKIARDFEEFQG